MEAEATGAAAARRVGCSPRWVARVGRPGADASRPIATVLAGAGKRILAHLRRERGMMTLTEVLVAAPLMIASLGAVLSLNTFSVNEQDRVESRVRAGIDEQIGLARMTRDLRQATRFLEAGVGSNYVEFEAYLKRGGSAPAELRRLYYGCNTTAHPGECVRREGRRADPSNPDSATIWETQDVVVLSDSGKRVTNTDVFTLAPATRYDPVTDSQVFEDKPRQVTVRLALAVENSYGARTPNPANPIVVRDAVELPNTRPGDEAPDGCDGPNPPLDC